MTRLMIMNEKRREGTRERERQRERERV